MVQVPVPPNLDRRGLSHLAALPAQCLKELREHSAAHEVPLDALDRLQLTVDPATELLQERVDALEEVGLIVLVGGVEGVQEVAQVVGDDTRVIQAPQAPLPREARADLLDRRETIVEG